MMSTAQHDTIVNGLEGLGICVNVKARELIQISNESPNLIYLILAGKVKQVLTDKDGNERTVLILKANQMFGELSYFIKRNNMVATIALEPSRLLVLTAADFETWLEDSNNYRQLVQQIAWKFRIALNQINDFSFKTTQERLCDLLHRLAIQHGRHCSTGLEIDLRLTHQEIANMIGASRSNVSRSLKKLENEKAIQIRRKTIIILDQRCLQRHSPDFRSNDSLDTCRS